MWYRTLQRLHGFEIDVHGDVQSWPTPEGTLRWHPFESGYAALLVDTPISVVTGTYDSFLVECPAERVDEVRAWMLWTMEQPWAELGGRRFPADPSMGENWGKKDEANVTGLDEISYRPLSATWPL